MSSPRKGRVVPQTGSRGTARIVIADDHKLVRRGIRMLLDREPDLEVVAEAGDIDTARRYVRAHHPDVLVLDLAMPGPPVLKAIPQLCHEAPQTNIVVLTMQDDPAIAREALQAGALSYVLKEAAAGELVNALRLAATGRPYLNPQLGARLALEPPPAADDNLSDVELHILRAVALGRNNQQIADELYLSLRTLESRRRQMQQKIGVTRVSQLVRYALTHGLLDGD
jgi:two-component system, NarL family, response regulator NreC